MLEKIEALIQEELERANKRYPLFSSAHEGWAVICEEVNEADEKMKLIYNRLEDLWKDVRENTSDHTLLELEILSIQAIEELIQVAAMAKKWSLSFLAGENNSKTIQYTQEDITQWDITYRVRKPDKNI